MIISIDVEKVENNNNKTNLLTDLVQMECTST